MPGPTAAQTTDGTAWFLGDGEVRTFDGSSWARYRAFQQPGALAIGPDGMVLVATVPGFDEEGELLAIRHAPPPHP
jgi:hypothetical protein